MSGFEEYINLVVTTNTKPICECKYKRKRNFNLLKYATRNILKKRVHQSFFHIIPRRKLME